MRSTPPLTVVLDDIRSAYNVGAIMRTLDAVGGGEIVCCGITPYPDLGSGDDRSPVVKSSNTKAIAKTALGAERELRVEQSPSAAAAIDRARGECERPVIGLEQADGAVDVFAFEPPRVGFVLVVGAEVSGLAPSTLALCDSVVEIPQRGTKESLNVSVAAGIALYALAIGGGAGGGSGG